MALEDLSGKRIIVAPLNWGLGHATRCMPLIDAMLRRNAEVILAGDGRSLQLLREEYPGLMSVELPSYHVRYTSGAAMVAMTLLRTPLYLNSVRREHLKLAEYVDSLRPDLVISDTRYGLWSPHAPSVFLCHQLSVIPPRWFSLAEAALYRLHRQFMDRFTETWVPDLEGPDNLSGRLSHRYAPSPATYFIGPLSRFRGMELPVRGDSEEKYVAVLSGPEPQRTLLEEQIAKQAMELGRPFLIVQGKTESRSERRVGCVRFVSYLTASELYGVMQQAEVVVARSGYSTLMDLCAIRKKALFIPTPGQTEQEYLAGRLKEKGRAAVQQQGSLDLAAGLLDAERLSGFNEAVLSGDLEAHLDRAMARLL